MLPLAEEYQLDHLKAACHKVLLQYKEPRLEFVTLAEKYGLTELLSKAIKDCAVKLSHGDNDCFTVPLERQVQSAENKDISYESLYKIYRCVFSSGSCFFDVCICEKTLGNFCLYKLYFS